MAPVGEFTISPDMSSRRHYGAVAAGSGITPVLSLVSTTLELEPECRWTLVYGNRGAGSIMFLEELEGLKNRYPNRLQIVHVLSREDTAVPLLSGRIDETKLEELWQSVLSAGDVDDWFLCGPFEMVESARGFLAGKGAERIHDELFFAGPIDPSLLPAPAPDEAGTVSLSFQLEGRTTLTRMRPETSVLDAAMAVRSELPYSCKGGMCASCKAKVVSGDVRMERNYALIDSEIEAGYVLTCQAHPLSDEVEIDYDQR
jgi:ring-1,2-phenylacetyl-CoA epoxidase subunit PaaE